MGIYGHLWTLLEIYIITPYYVSELSHIIFSMVWYGMSFFYKKKHFYNKTILCIQTITYDIYHGLVWTVFFFIKKTFSKNVQTENWTF